MSVPGEPRQPHADGMRFVWDKPMEQIARAAQNDLTAWFRTELPRAKASSMSVKPGNPTIPAGKAPRRQLDVVRRGLPPYRAKDPKLSYSTLKPLMIAAAEDP